MRIILGLFLTSLLIVGWQCEWVDSQPGQAPTEQTITQLVNQYREEQQLPALTVNNNIAVHARIHCWFMSQEGYIYHADDITGGADHYYEMGEIIGRGPTEEAIMEAWIRSADHYPLLVHDWTDIGVGAYQHPDGTVWAVVRFLR